MCVCVYVHTIILHVYPQKPTGVLAAGTCGVALRLSGRLRYLTCEAGGTISDFGINIKQISHGFSTKKLGVN